VPDFLLGNMHIFLRAISWMMIVSLLQGCENLKTFFNKRFDKSDVPEIHNDIFEINANELRNSHFFHCSDDFDFEYEEIEDITALVKNAKSKGIDNVGFLLISHKQIPLDSQIKIKKLICRLLHKQGIMDSRIVDMGTCIYADAKNGVRVDILEYQVEKIDTGLWTENIGDTDIRKHLPKFGVSQANALNEMIANKADLVSPRKYKGQEINSAISSVPWGK